MLQDLIVTSPQALANAAAHRRVRAGLAVEAARRDLADHDQAVAQGRFASAGDVDRLGRVWHRRLAEAEAELAAAEQGAAR